MFSLVIAAIGGAIVGGVVNGVATSNANKKKLAATEKAAKDMKKATEEYSGKRALEKMYEAGLQNAQTYGTSVGNEMASQSFTPQSPGSTNAGVNTEAMQSGTEAGNTAKSATQSGFETGMANQAALNAAEYNKQAAKTDLELKQADIDYNVANQTAQGLMNMAGQGLGVANQVIPKNVPTVSTGIKGKPVIPNNGNPLMD